MWDLDSIIQQHNESGKDLMQAGRQLNEAQSPLPIAWALALLAEKMQAGPPLLDALIGCLENYRSGERFANLIRQFLPERLTDIMMEPRNRRVHAFCYWFGKKYYPLPANTHCPIGQWVDGIPVELLGMSYSAYHNLDFRLGYGLLLSLVIYPYEGDDRDMEQDDLFTPFGDPKPKKKGKTLLDIFTGGRVPVLDAVQNTVGPDLAKSIPDAGWFPEELHTLTDGTPYDGVGAFADWVCSETGCVILDCSADDCEFMEGWNEPVFKWTEHNVDVLTHDWPKVQALREKIDHIVEWLEADPVNRFGELLNFLLTEAPRKLKGKKKVKRGNVYDPTEHWCPLDQQTDDDEEEEDGSNETQTGFVLEGNELREATRENIAAAAQF